MKTYVIYSPEMNELLTVESDALKKQDKLPVEVTLSLVNEKTKKSVKVFDDNKFYVIGVL